MGFISFTFTKAYFYFIIYWTLDFLNSIEIKFFVKYTQYNGEYQKEFILLYLICVNIGELLSGILVIITKIKMNYLGEKEIKRPSRNSHLLIYNDLSLKKNKRILIFLMSLFDFLGRGADFLYLLFFDVLNLQPSHISWLISVDILSRIFFCRMLLKIRIYRHHIYSIILCSIGFFIMIIFSLKSIISDENGEYNTFHNWAYIIFIIAQKIFFSSGDTIGKILLTNKFLLPHYLMFYKSVISFIFFIILIPILFFTSKLSYNNFENLFQTGDIRLHIFLKILLIISAFFGIFSIFQIIYIFTPIHVAFINVASALFQIIQFTIFNNQVEHLIYLIFYIICLIVIGFGTLVFTEILVINVWGLNEYTRQGFLIKEELDQFPPDATILMDDKDEGLELNATIDDKKVNKTVRYSSKTQI